MAPRCGCGSSGVCNCLVTAGTGVTVTGSGSTGNPYVVSSTAGSCVTTTLAAITALQTAGTLNTCTTYIVTDWVTPNALPGPNFLFVRAVAANKLSEDVRVYCSGQVDAVLGTYVGPVRGKYMWGGLIPGMYYLESVLGNRVSDLSGTLATIDALPWNTFLVRENTIDTVTFTGGYATLSTLAAASGLNLSENKITGGTLNLTGITTVVAITDCEMVSPNLILVGPIVVVDSCSLASGAKIDLTGKTAGSLTMRRCSIKQDQATVGTAAITFDGDANLVLNDVELLGSNLGYSSDTDVTWSNVQMNHTTVLATAGTRGFAVTGTSMVDSSVFQTRTGGPTSVDTLSRSSLVGASFSLSGATNPATNQLFEKIVVDVGDIAATNPATANPMLAVVVEGAGILNVTAGGSISSSRVSCGATLNTGAFAQTSVIVDGAFTKTATAANTNTLTNKSFDDLV